MALKDYYELSAMLRMQLPILLSFAVLRCLIGFGAKIWARTLVPLSLHKRAKPVWEATNHILSIMHGALLIVSLFYWATNYNAWSVCGAYEMPRVQGLVCAIGLLALITNSNPFTHGLALSTLKAVADGSGFAILLAAFTWRACVGSHRAMPLVFYGALFPTTISYTMYCHSDKASEDRTGGPVLALAFACLVLGTQASTHTLRKIWELWVAARRAAWRSMLECLCKVGVLATPPRPVLGPTLPEPENQEEADELAKARLKDD